jgi:ADP-ribosylglycohydrolase
VEFEQGRAIVAAHPERLRSFVSGQAGWPPGTITDDTQMTLFTMEGLGLLPETFSTEWVFDAATEAAGYTHSHPSGKLAAGALGAIIHEICGGATLEAALDTSMELLTSHEGHEETPRRDRAPPRARLRRRGPSSDPPVGRRLRAGVFPAATPARSSRLAGALPGLVATTSGRCSAS